MAVVPRKDDGDFELGQSQNMADVTHYREIFSSLFPCLLV